MQRPKKILIIEDDIAIRDTLAEILQSQGYATSLANNGKEGLEKLRTTSAPDLIVLDLMMPIMDGVTFRKKQILNESWAHIPVVVLSADGQMKNKLKEINCAAYLKKPINLDELIDIVNKNCS